MLAAPAARGPLRGREPVHARRAPRRQPARARRDRRDDGAARRRSSGAGSAAIERSALQLRPRVRGLGRRGALRAPGRAHRGSEGVPCGEVLIGAIKPWECRVFGTACTPERPIGTCMVSSEGACAAYYTYGRLREPARPRPGVRPRRPKLRDELVTLAHGAGGKATRALVEGLFLEELGNPLLAPLGDAALLDVNGARLAFTTDSYVVKPLFFPGGDIGELAVNGTVNDLAVVRRAAARALGRLRDRGGLPGRRPAPRSPPRWRARRAAAGVADRRRRHEGRRARQGRRPLRDDRRASALVAARRRARPAARPARRPRARLGHASATTAWR